MAGNIIFQGDDTCFAGVQQLAAIVLRNVYDMTGWQLEFVFQNISKKFNLVTDYDDNQQKYICEIQPEFTKEQTAQFKKGVSCASLILTDLNGKIHTVATDIRYQVITFRSTKNETDN